jgi:S1-C subfamily serine protease
MPLRRGGLQRPRSDRRQGLHSQPPTRPYRDNRRLAIEWRTMKSTRLWTLPLLIFFIPAVCVAQSKTPQVSPADIYERTHSSVVVVIVFDGNEKPTGQGSGFIVAKNRIVTNHHVVQGAADALVVFADGTSELVAGVAADSPARDLAILVVKTGPRLPLTLGDEDSVRQGDTVYALGAPRGLESSFTSGIVSGFRDLGDQFRLQTTAPIAPGSSGGPLFNSSGRVIGVTTELLTDSPGIYFSIAARDVKHLLRTPNLVSTPFSVRSQENTAAAESAAKGNSGGNKANSSDGESVVAGKSQALHGTEVWRNLCDGQTYRTSSNGEVMHLESVDGYAKPAADILGCDFKKAASVGSSWTGACVERNQKDRSTSGSRATLTTFSDTEMEGSTEYIPEFVMIPVGDASFQRGQLVPGESAARGGVHIVTDVIGATAVLHGAFGRVLGECQTPCGFHDLVPTPYTVEVQRKGYRSVQIALRVMAGKVWQQKIELDKVLAEVPPTTAEPPHGEKSSPTATPHKTAPGTSAETAEYAGRIEEVISEKGLMGRVEVQRNGNTIVLLGKLRPAEHGALLKFLRDAPENVRVVDHIEYHACPN